MAKNYKIIEGKALWAKVLKPDTKFVPAGEYSIDVLIPEEKAEELCEYLEGLIDNQLKEEVKANPGKAKSLSTRSVREPNYDQDGNETGELKFRCKFKAQIQARDGRTYNQKPIVVDAKRNPVDEDMAIGNGSTVKVAVEPFTYVMASTKQVGVTLRLRGVQVIDLVEYGNKGGNMFDEEDGFVAEKLEKQEVNFDDEGDYAESVEGDF
jgi:hypothetical protein